MTVRSSKSEFQGGFTLLEVVVAMAIVGLGVVTLLDIFSGGMRLQSRISAATEVTARGGQIMDNVFIRASVAEGKEEGFAGPSHPWRLEVTPFVPEAELSASKGWELKEVALEIRYTEGGRERRMEMRTLRLLKEKNP